MKAFAHIMNKISIVSKPQTIIIFTNSTSTCN